MLFLIDLLKAFKKNKVNVTYVPSYKELTVKSVYPELKGIKLLMRYFPNYPDNILLKKFYVCYFIKTLPKHHEESYC